MSEKSKSWELMLGVLLLKSQRSDIQRAADMTEFTETVLLKGYEISKGRKFYAKNLESSEFR